MLKCGVYKYVYHNEIIYIGMSAHSIPNRINGHKKELKFQPYLDDVEIYFIPLSSKTEAKGVESLLINKYKPALNIKEINNITQSIDIEPTLPSWRLYTDDVTYHVIYESSVQQNKKVKTRTITDKELEKCHKQHLWNLDIAINLVDAFNNNKYYIRNNNLYIDCSEFNTLINKNKDTHFITMYDIDKPIPDNEWGLRDRTIRHMVGTRYVPNHAVQLYDLPKCKNNNKLQYYEIPYIVRSGHTWQEVMTELLIPFCEFYIKLSGVKLYGDDFYMEVKHD